MEHSWEGRAYMPDCIYLRKSRVDAEAEVHGAKDTLGRHEQELLRHASRLGRTIGHIYREVVSGETISARPQMQQLLRDVEAGAWDAVHVMEVERLARGDTLDQGIVSQTFLYSKTLIVTPKKIYDPSNEFDEEYFEFGLFMSRREYKTINRRQQAGRLASLQEGKWVANKAPYGYTRVKLQGEKGWSLEAQEPQASVVRDMFRWLTVGYEENGGIKRLGTSQIARRLTNLGVPSPTGADWLAGSVRDILRNDVYAGWVHWGRRAAQKTLSNGTLSISRPRANRESYPRFHGLHIPLIEQETFDLAQRVLGTHPSRPGPKNAVTRNPLAGLVICGHCGRTMVRRPFQSGRQEVLLCPYSACHTKASDLHLVESALLSFVSDMLEALEAPQAEREERSSDNNESNTLKRALAYGEKEMAALSAQEKRAFELVEQDVYTVNQFIIRSKELSEQKQALSERLDALRQEIQQFEAGQFTQKEIVPQLRHVLDCYHETEEASEKNALLKSILSKVVYTKTSGGRYQESNLKLFLFPRFTPLP